MTVNTEQQRHIVQKSGRKRFRALVESTDWLKADFYARDLAEAEEKAGDIDGGLFTLNDSDWNLTEVVEVADCDIFDPVEE